MEEFEYYSPKNLSQLLQFLAVPGGRIIAGGTDLIPKLRSNTLNLAALIDISHVEELRFIREDDERVHIGARTTYADVLESPLLARYAPVLIQATHLVASPMARARGTIGGNIGNASPAGDTFPPLLVLNAEATLLSPTGQRALPLEQVVVGPMQTVLAPDEIIHHISFNKPSANCGFGFEKLGPRQGMTISIATAAAAIELNTNQTISAVRIAFGAVAPTPIRCKAAEQLLLGRKASAESWKLAVESAVNIIAPIDDVRASADYRRKAAGVLLERALRTAAELAKRSA